MNTELITFVNTTRRWSNQVHAEETHSEFSQTSKKELFAKIFKRLKPLIIFTKSSILEVWKEIFRLTFGIIFFNVT